MGARVLGALLVICAACSGDGEGGDGADDENGGSPGGGNGGAVTGGTGGQGNAGSGGATETGGGAGGIASGGGGGSSTGGAMSGGTGGFGGMITGGGGNATAATGGVDSADHCAPGEYYAEGYIMADRPVGGLSINCSGTLREQAIANGIGDDGSGWVDIQSLLLPQAMATGAPTSISWEIDVIGDVQSSRQLEFWAATSECGSTGDLERFYLNESPTTAVYCASITPTVAYTYILVVHRPSPNLDAKGGLTFRGATVCMSGECPAP